MRFSVRGIVIVAASAALIFFGSCDKHRLGELPEVQKEHVDLAHGAKEAPAATDSAAPEKNATPAEFFPEKEPQ